MIYAIFDLDFDRAHGIHSVPVTWARRVRCASPRGRTWAPSSCSCLVGVIAGLPAVYWAGLVVVAGLLAWTHVDIARRGLSRVGMSFMTVNGVVGLVYGATWL